MKGIRTAANHTMDVVPALWVAIGSTMGAQVGTRNGPFSSDDQRQSALATILRSPQEDVDQVMGRSCNLAHLRNREPIGIEHLGKMKRGRNKGD